MNNITKLILLFIVTISIIYILTTDTGIKVIQTSNTSILVTAPKNVDDYLVVWDCGENNNTCEKNKDGRIIKFEYSSRHWYVSDDEYDYSKGVPFTGLTPNHTYQIFLVNIVSEEDVVSDYTYIKI